LDTRDPFDLCGVTIDAKYRVASVVGDGGFGVVYRGVHKGFGELIAIKCLKIPGDLDDAARSELLEKLQEEGRLLHRLSKATSGIVQALDVGAMTTPGGTWVPYLVLEWLEGETLGEFLKARLESGKHGMDLLDAITLLDPVAKALAVAHAQKVAHRDVKPANIFLTEVGGTKTAKVLDFGIAKVLSDHRGYTTALESTNMTPAAFTPRYGAPEQFNKQRGATGPWTDVFALALVLVECVSGRKALEGDDPTQLYIASADPELRPTLKARGVSTNEAVDRVLTRALEVEPKNRYADLGAFWSALREAVGLETGDTLAPRASSPRESRPRPDLAQSGPTDPAHAGPTMPVESLKAPRKRSSSPRDEMEETPPGERKTRANAEAAREQSKPSSSKGSIVFTLVALAVFAGGGAFAYFTITNAGSGARTTASVSADHSASVRSKPTAKGSAQPTARTSASAAPSASTQVSASAQPSASTSPTEPPPDGMVLVKGATITTGAKEITIADFYLSRDEVTVGDYLACMNAAKCEGGGSVRGLEGADKDTWEPKCNLKRSGFDKHPMNCVTAREAEAFCTYKGGRLPTDAEWELAARGPRGRKYVWGAGAPTCDLACWGKNDACADQGKEIIACSVGSFAEDQTELGLRDLAGNVAEWTASGGAERIVRGASFFDDAEALVAAHTATRAASTAHPTVGFRCAMAPKPAP
jgi:serine/threonine-protein kinase